MFIKKCFELNFEHKKRHQKNSVKKINKRNVKQQKLMIVALMNKKLIDEKK